MNDRIKGVGLVFSVALIAALVVVLASANGASAQVPTPPTVEGLGECQPEHNVEILNDSANITPEDTVERNSQGGFEAIFVTNCIIYAIKFSIVDYEGKAVEGGVGTRYVHEQYSEIDYVPHSQYIEHKRYTSDFPDTETCQYENTCTGEPIIDEQGIALQETPPEAVTAYRVTFDFTNSRDGLLGSRPLDKNLDYSLNVELVPFNGAPANLVHTQTLLILSEASGNLWDKVTRAFEVTTWVEKGTNMIFLGWGGAILNLTCEGILPFSDIPTDENGVYTHENKFASRKIVNPDTGVTEWIPYKNWDDPEQPSGNNSCKMHGRKNKEGQREDIYEEALALYNDERAVAGLPPMRNEYEIVRNYGTRVIDGVDPREAGEGNPNVVELVAYDMRHVTLAPRVIFDRDNYRYAAINVFQHITLFDGILLGTPPELTYLRGFTRLGWSIMINLATSLIVLFIAWMGLGQIIRALLGTRSVADWREIVPRLLLSVIAMLTSYWICSMLIDLADGISRYVAAAFDVSTGDVVEIITFALTAVFLQQKAAVWAAGLGPHVGFIVSMVILFIKGLQLLLIKVFLIMFGVVLLQLVLRILLINLLIIISPLAMMMWSVPETAGWGKKWFSLFMISLFQHAIQIMAIGMAMFFVQSATVIPSLQLLPDVSKVGTDVLGVETIWALVMGIMMMTLVFKIPGMLGAGSMYEGFLSTITFALAAAKMAGAIATGGPGGMAAMMGGGSPGGSPSGLMTSAGQGVNTGPGAMAANMMSGLGNTARSVGTGLLRGGREIIGGGGSGGGSSRRDVASGEPPTPSGPVPAVGQAAQSFSAPGASVLNRGITGNGFEGKATGNGRAAAGSSEDASSGLAKEDRAAGYQRPGIDQNFQSQTVRGGMDSRGRAIPERETLGARDPNSNDVLSPGSTVAERAQDEGDWSNFSGDKNLNHIGNQLSKEHGVDFREGGWRGTADSENGNYVFNNEDGRSATVGADTTLGGHISGLRYGGGSAAGALNRAGYEGAREARGGQIGEDYRDGVGGESNPFSPSGQRFSEAAAGYNKISEGNDAAFHAMQGNVRASELENGGVRLENIDDMGRVEGAPRDLPAGDQTGDYISDIGVDRYNNAARLSSAMDGEDSAVTERGPQVAGSEARPHGYEAPGYEGPDSRMHIDESNMAQVWATQKQGEDAGVKIGDRGESISTPDGGAGTAENAVRYDRGQGMRPLDDAEKDHVYGKVGADGGRSGGIGVGGFNQSLQGVTSNNALSRGDVGSLARNSGMSRSESKKFAKELTSSKVGSEVNGRGQLRVGPGHYMRPTAKQRAFIDSVGGASSFNQQFSAKHGLSNKNAASTTAAPAAVSSGPGGFDALQKSVRSRAGAGWRAGSDAFTESQGRADNRQVMLVRDHAGRTSVGSDALQQVNRSHGSEAGFGDAMGKRLEVAGGRDQLRNMETGRLGRLSETDRRAEIALVQHGQSGEQANESVRAAKTGQSVQTISTDSETVAAEMGKGQVNVVALNADGSHEFRHANAAEMQRMSALQGSNGEKFVSDFNDLHKGQLRRRSVVG